MSFKKFPLHVSAIVLDLDGTLCILRPSWLNRPTAC